MRLFPTFAFLLAGLLALPVAAADTWTQPFKGVRLLHRVTSTQDLWVLKVDLCEPGVSVRTTTSAQRQQKTSTFASSVPGGVAAVNGDFFSFSTYSPSGPARSGTSTWGGSDDGFNAPLSFGNGDVRLNHHSNTLGFEPWMEQVISGHPSVLHNFDVVNVPNYDVCQARHPRTAAGLSQDRQTLFLAVVDGRRTGAAGMTCAEVGTMLKGLGAWRAMNLDGGGSSTMWLKNSGVKNQPSDGSERVVANHLVVRKATALRGRHCPLPFLKAELDGFSPSFSPETIVLEQGQTLFGRIRVKNTGASTWTSTVRLAPTPRDVASPLADASWISPSRVGVLDEDTLPGAVGRFSFTLRGNEVGTFEQTFNLVRSGVWFSDDGGPGDGVIKLRVEVVPPAGTEPDPEPDAGSVVEPADDVDAGAAPDVAADAGSLADPDPDADVDAGSLAEPDPDPGTDAGSDADPDDDAGEADPEAFDDDDEALADLPSSVVSEGGCRASGGSPLWLLLGGLLLVRRRSVSVR